MTSPQSDSTLDTDHGAATSTLEWVATSDLHRDPELNFRGPGADAPDEELRRSLAEHGVHEPLVVLETGDGYVLLDGNRRHALLLALGVPTVPARVWRNLTREQAVDIAVAVNERRKCFSSLDRGRVLRFHHGRGTLPKALDHLRLGQKQAQNLIAVSGFAERFPEVEQQILAKGKFGTTHALELSRALPEDATAAQVAEWIHRVNTEALTVRDLQRALGKNDSRSSSDPLARGFKIEKRAGRWRCKFGGTTSAVPDLDPGVARRIRAELVELVRLFDDRLREPRSEPALADDANAADRESGPAQEHEELA